jgi:predicted nucleic acid-binding protein
LALILDTGPLVAAADPSDPDHERCAELVRGTHERRVIPILALVEVEYLLRPWPSGFLALMDDVHSGRLELHCPVAGELVRATELVDTYRDLPLGLVDASVLAAVSTSARTSSPRSTAVTSASCARRTSSI